MNKILAFFIILIAVGIIWWAVDRYLPLPQIIKGVLAVATVILVVWMCLGLFGLVPSPI